MNIVAEVLFPGSRIQSADPEWSQTVRSALDTLARHLAEAAVALSLFIGSRTRSVPFESSDDAWARSIRREQLAAELALADGKELESLPSDQAELYRIQVQSDDNAERVAAGELPPSYASLRPRLYAKSFVYALHEISKELEFLAGLDGMPTEIAACVNHFHQAVPDLKSIRDSIAHFDERRRGLGGMGKSKKKIDPQPVVNDWLHDADGRARILGALVDDRYVFTVYPDGKYCEVAVRAETLAAVRDAIQHSILAFSWTGHPQLEPYW